MAHPIEENDVQALSPPGGEQIASRAETTSAGRVGHIRDRYAVGTLLEFEPDADRKNHNVFRYPAKFHPPIARRLIELFSSSGETILDPFCGSGTLLVEAASLGRNSVGTDVDPLAILIARAKTVGVNRTSLDATVAVFVEWCEEQRRDDLDRFGPFDLDIGSEILDGLRPEIAAFIPELPRIGHWFRNRVVLQLATLRRRVADIQDEHSRRILTLCFASIIRNSSNADPVPVSGLEVTSHMLAREAKGRTIDPWLLMKRATAKTVAATVAFAQVRDPEARCVVREADARHLDRTTIGAVDAIITSPPYLTAVDYYRRHTLEMYWLGLTERREQRLDVMTRYIGRDRVGLRHFPVEDPQAAAVADRWIGRFPSAAPARQRAFRHYCDGMFRALVGMSEIVAGNGAIVVVAGDVRFCGMPVSMLELIKDLAADKLKIADHLWYPIINRYMSYKRNNEANIAVDHVIVLRRP
ncbi:TRM11 family SAM-dependent methyltransferase [Glacieibacterium megasporae]|uniref:TRM11 family SAM-dependent methyltransferase n=1 Tax=Glacieibacterium megasporae TaxID=2835787 RepID=UPI001C1E29CF|nr:DNA methyltransferase [Polymorphobacter megasporae]UAJ10683.1 50S ribosomal protein L11 methyltransferase [Polymorphobacter megasporae]